MIYISRNPKDTAVSMFHYYRDNPNLPTVDTWPAFFDLFLKGNGKDNVFSLQFMLVYYAQKELRNLNCVKTPYCTPYPYGVSGDKFQCQAKQEQITGCSLQPCKESFWEAAASLQLNSSLQILLLFAALGEQGGGWWQGTWGDCHQAAGTAMTAGLVSSPGWETALGSPTKEPGHVPKALLHTLSLMCCLRNGVQRPRTRGRFFRSGVMAAGNRTLFTLATPIFSVLLLLWGRVSP